MGYWIWTSGWGRKTSSYSSTDWDNLTPLSPRALAAFFSFLEHAEFPAGRKLPSLFFTDDGHLELCWEAGTGDAVQVEFEAWESEVYDEGSGREGANRILNGSGAFWKQEYRDRFNRDASHMAKVREYIVQNPVKAGRVKTASDWKWTGT